MHPAYSRSKYLRSSYPIIGDQISEGSFQQQKLPPLLSVLLLKNDIIIQKIADNLRNSSHLDSCFSIIQLSQTGALYLQTFRTRDKKDPLIQSSVPSNRFNLQISEMVDSIASLHNLADMDVGTIPELRVKQNQNWHFERLWNCKYLFYMNDFYFGF